MSRHKARQQALEILFSREFHGTNDIQYSETEILERDAVTAEDLKDARPEGAKTVGVYAQYLVDTTTEHRDELDKIIESYAKGWEVSRMNKTDCNIMRLALCELVYPKEPTPASVVLNEAVILAKEYSGAQSARFVNGILGAYVKALG